MAFETPVDPGMAAQIAEVLAGVAWQCAADCRAHLLEGGSPDGCCISHCKLKVAKSRTKRQFILC